MNEPYLPGELVRLKSGGPTMTVEIHTAPDVANIVGCVWFSKAPGGGFVGPHRENFRAALIARTAYRG